MKKHLKSSKILCLASAALVAAGITIGAARHSSEIDHFLRQTPYQKEVERKIGKPVYFPWGTDTNARDRELRDLEEKIKMNRDQWDNFDYQFRYIKSIEISPDPIVISRESQEAKYPPAAAVAYKNGRLKIFSASPPNLSHELSHLWHFHAPKSFNVEWDAVSNGTHYKPNKRRVELQDLINTVSLTAYGCLNREENVSKTADLVFYLNGDPQWFYFPGIPKDQNPTHRSNGDYPSNYSDSETIKEVLPKIMPKLIYRIKLLEKYGAISHRESEHAISRLKTYFPPER